MNTGGSQDSPLTNVQPTAGLIAPRREVEICRPKIVRGLATPTKEVVARLNKKWDEDTEAFDEVYAHLLHMADALSDGIVMQFPQKF